MSVQKEYIDGNIHKYLAEEKLFWPVYFFLAFPFIGTSLTDYVQFVQNYIFLAFASREKKCSRKEKFGEIMENGLGCCFNYRAECKMVTPIR
jgi:hypothetical protein